MPKHVANYGQYKILSEIQMRLYVCVSNRHLMLLSYGAHKCAQTHADFVTLWQVILFRQSPLWSKGNPRSLTNRLTVTRSKHFISHCQTHSKFSKNLLAEITTVWHVTSCSLVDSHLCFLYAEDRGIISFQNDVKSSPSTKQNGVTSQQPVILTHTGCHNLKYQHINYFYVLPIVVVVIIIIITLPSATPSLSQRQANKSTVYCVLDDQVFGALKGGGGGYSTWEVATKIRQRVKEHSALSDAWKGPTETGNRGRDGCLAVTSLLGDTWQPGVPIGPKITSYPSSSETHSPPSLR
jgi:hypothetical protein